MTEMIKHTDVVAMAEPLQDVVEQALEEAGRQGASSAEADASISQGLSATVRLGEVETIENNRDKTLAVSVYFGHSTGSASTSDMSAEAIRKTVAAACSIASRTAPDDCGGLADADRMATEFPDLDLWHPWNPTAEQAIKLAWACEDAARGCDSRISNSEGATVSSHEGVGVYGNSHGFLGTRYGTRHSLSCAVIAADEAGMERDYWYSIERNRKDLQSAEEIGVKAARRSVKRLGARKIKSCQVPVLYEAPVASSLLSHFASAINGGNLYRKSSFLLDYCGKQVFPASINISDQPFLRGALGSAAFDSEGVATQERDLVLHGVLEGYLLNSYAARKLGMQTTGNAGGAHNLVIEPGEYNLDGLIKEMGTGLLVTELIGFGVNNVTGDYSRGAAGFWVENGQVAYPVSEITIASNLKDMFMQVMAVGNDVEQRGTNRTGSILIENMTIAGE
jgi:PmbA protein